MSKINEIVHVSIRSKSILSFRVEIEQKFGNEHPSANAILTHIAGTDRPFPEEPTWEALGHDYLTDYFASHGFFTIEDYDDSISNAQAAALSRLVRM